jgi:hypothetical protein
MSSTCPHLEEGKKERQEEGKTLLNTTATEQRTAKAELTTAADLVADGLTEQTALEFIAHRKRKRSPLSPRGWQGIKREAAKAGWLLEDAVVEALARGWTAFKADWVKADATRNGHHGKAEPDFFAGVRAMAARRAGQEGEQ